MTVNPPTARKIRTERRIHDRLLIDDYAWMCKTNDPEVIGYLESENAYCNTVMASTADLQAKLYEEMVSHMDETDWSVPFKEGRHYYYSKWESGKQYPVFVRKQSLSGLEEETLLDLNVLAEGQQFMGLGAFKVSDSGRLLAYSTDNSGFRRYHLRVRDLETREDLPDFREGCVNVAWADTDDILFYTVEDNAKRSYRLFRHKVGTDCGEDILVYEEKDERFALTVSRSRSGQFVFLAIESETASEFRCVRAAAPCEPWRVILPRRESIQYSVEHIGDLFYIRTNDRGQKFRLITVPLADHGNAGYKELLPHREDVSLDRFEGFRSFYVVFESERGSTRVTVVDLLTNKSKWLPVPEAACLLTPYVNRDFDTRVFRYSYQSLITPTSLYEFDVLSGVSTLVKKTEVPGYQPERYCSERAWARNDDGTEVPVSIVYRKDRSLGTDESSALYVYGYGAYGTPVQTLFSSSRLSLLDRGVVVAYAHIRGGGELGKEWHDAGRQSKKHNAFSDFILCCNYLVKNGYGAKDRLAVESASAGGVLIGAVLNLRPEMVRVAILGYPFVDVINTMLDPSLPLTITEYDEWGDPNTKEGFESMLSYSPYDCVKTASYPAMLVKNSLHDSQVMFWEPAKYVAKLRSLNAGSNALLLKTNMAAGHGGASGRYDQLKELAFDYAFLLRNLGVDS